MRKNVSVTLTGYGRESLRLTFDDEPTLEEVIEKSGWTLASTEKASVNGEVAELTDTIENGDTIQIVGKKEGGR